MASVDLDVLLFFSSLLFCSCFSSFGVVIFGIVQDLLNVSTNVLVFCQKSMNVSTNLLVSKSRFSGFLLNSLNVSANSIVVHESANVSYISCIEGL